MDLLLDGWMVAWDDDGETVEVGPWPDKTGWSDEYSYTSGCCYVERQSFAEELRVAMLFIDFHTIVVGYSVAPAAAHREFLKIGEYRRRISPDLPGAEI